MTRATTFPETITLHVPFRVVKRGGRKEMLLPPGASTQRSQVDNTLVKALAGAFRWKLMLDTGKFATVAELARREGIAVSYLTRILGLTLLAPELVEAILEGRQLADLTLEKLREPAPDEWQTQMSWLYRNREVAERTSHPLPSAIACGYKPTDNESE